MKINSQRRIVEGELYHQPKTQRLITNIAKDQIALEYVWPTTFFQIFLFLVIEKKENSHAQMIEFIRNSMRWSSPFRGLDVKMVLIAVDTHKTSHWSVWWCCFSQQQIIPPRIPLFHLIWCLSRTNMKVKQEVIKLPPESFLYSLNAGAEANPYGKGSYVSRESRRSYGRDIQQSRTRSFTNIKRCQKVWDILENASLTGRREKKVAREPN